MSTALAILYGSPRGLSTVGMTRLVPSGPGFERWYLRYVGDDLAAGDLTGDGVDDLVVRIGEAIDTGSDFGDSALVVYTGGSAGLSTANDRRFPVSEDDLDEFGTGLDSFAIGDFDGNGTSELAVAARSITLLTFTSAGLGTARTDVVDDRGFNLTAGDTNGDGRDDLAFASVPFFSDVTSVGLLFGSPTGLGPAGSREFSDIDLGLSEGYSYRLALAPLDAGPTADLVIADPYARVHGVDTAGAVVVLFGGPNGPTADHRLRLDEATAGVPGSAERGDTFGAAVTVGFSQGADQAVLAVGAPDETTSATRAGRAYVFPRGAAGPKARGTRALSLDTAGVKGSSHPKSRFGYRLARQP